MDFADKTDSEHFSSSITLGAMTNVALIVGAASNIGYQVLKKVNEVYNGKIYFTTEDETIGYNLLQTVKRPDWETEYLQMDVSDTNSIIKVRHHIQDNEERIDLIINNTEYVPTDKRFPNAEKVRRTLTVNFYGNLNFGKLVYPLLTKNARVVNVSGAAGLLKTIENVAIRSKFGDPSLTEDSLVEIMQEYEAAAKKGIEKTEGWGINVQAVSKVALSALTFLQHREWSDKGVVINCVNPGNLQSKDDRRSSKVFEEGAKAILYLALEAPLTLKGNFVWSDYNVIQWNSDPFIEVTSV